MESERAARAVFAAAASRDEAKLRADKDRLTKLLEREKYLHQCGANMHADDVTKLSAEITRLRKELTAWRERARRWSGMLAQEQYGAAQREMREAVGNE